MAGKKKEDLQAQIDAAVSKISGVSTKTGADMERYKPALAAGLDAIDQVRRILEALNRGDTADINLCVTKWKNINKLLAARLAMAEELKNPSSRVQLDAILDIIVAAAKVGVNIASLFV